MSVIMDNLDRILVQIKKWNEKEDRLRQIFGEIPELPVLLKIEKLALFDEIRHRYAGVRLNDRERFSFNVVNSERKSLARELYPTVGRRIIARASSFLYGNIRQRFNYGKAMWSAGKELEKIGIDPYSKELQTKIREEPNNFSIKSTIKSGEGFVHLTIEFARKPSGLYKINRYTAQLVGAANGLRAEFDSRYDVLTAIKLLTGVSVHRGDRWVVLDRNDSDAKGNNRKVEFPEQSFDLMGSITKLAPNNQDSEALHDRLKNGEMVETTFFSENGGTTVMLYANVQRQCLEAVSKDDLRPIKNAKEVLYPNHAKPQRLQKRDEQIKKRSNGNRKNIN